ncbi:MAG: U32 family peptidase [Eubacterium sp.]|nr:U32 family peptidase [Eubacterium sp.]
MTGNKPEVLAPCGNMTSLKAAIAAGADACYLAGNSFGARAYANNFSETELLEAIDLAHLYGVKIYLTANTLIKENEMNILRDSLIPLYEAGLDAVLVQDFGVLRMIRRDFPGLPIHTSTQMNITTPAGAQLARDLGAERVVAAREMTLEELAAIKREVDIELEAFVHGAMCFCYSGRCYFSSMVGGRSGNRGRCAQPCRQRYNGRYEMSMRDMCTLSHVPELLEAGVDSLKIEGRMKNEYYTAAAVDAYKQMVNDCLRGCFSKERAEKYEKRLLDTFNRGGFTDGYLVLSKYDKDRTEKLIDNSMPGRRGVLVGNVSEVGNGKISFKAVTDIFEGDEFLIDTEVPVNITSNKMAKKGSGITLNAPETRKIKRGTSIYRTRCRKLLEEIDEQIKNGRKISLEGSVKIRVGERMELRLGLKGSGNMVSVYGDEVQTASSKPVTEDVVRDKLTALGNTNYVLEDFDIDMDDGAFVPASILKNLRRQGIEELEKKVLGSYRRELKSADEELYEESVEKVEFDGKSGVHISVSDMEQLRAVLSTDVEPSFIYLDMGLERFSRSDLKLACGTIREKSSARIILAFPYINRSTYSMSDYEDIIKDVDGIYIRCIDDWAAFIDISKEPSSKRFLSGKTVILASSLYAYNTEAAEELLDMIGESRNEMGLSLMMDAPLELTSSEQKLIKYPEGVQTVRDIYGRLPLMVTDALGEKDIHLMDDSHRSVDAISTKKLCYSLILSDRPLSLHEYTDEIAIERFNFTTENNNLVKDVLSENPQYINKKYFTRGHYGKGIL